MSRCGRTRKDRARLLGTIADRDDIVEPLIDQFIDMLRSLVADIRTELLHGVHRRRVQASRMSTGAFRLEVVTRNQP
jgi:hypothetical protein